ncbi:tRNA (adenosine(37)-N6)-threonylcarbamoyltransferase complex ATPase subunit type 1 TsaE [Zafaria sp. Z1313]|uniref:tRNA (adenosine(37)-N6)-threonylcarbamoyltransferase complex ATPase subunit type 1 TsaE n=1 Tax=unclassified Zafaria TaxID=2828765 RepID=UPI002E761CC6|nr:tRNA (adenosine(37)-N6)-threonylcarbamoyltransferase complex ATPase subunit type 1 TsaE [Zafaria sp. J156]MEE1620505.1 tRNA (adenosine(37)-N6)-threonylcarbamoyltransferase complex ATPase subunit type 1 TsaE [Zafaria sp. J156]
MCDPGPATPVWVADVSTSGAETTASLARSLAPYLVHGDLLILTGPLGAGKTTFTQGLGDGLGVGEAVISPTFVLSRIHRSSSGGPDLVHVDAYRLASPADVDDIDLESTLADAVTVVEWGRGKVEHLGDSWLDIEFVREVVPGGGEERLVFDFDETGADEARQLTISAFGPRWLHRRPFEGGPTSEDPFALEAKAGIPNRPPCR